MPDARDATVTTGLHGRARVFCGGLDGLDAEGSYDFVVALGGPQRLLGPDSEGLTDAALVRLLAERVAEGGLLVTDIENHLGVHDLFATRPALDPDADEAWHVGAPGFGGRNLYRHEVDEVLADASLTVRAVFAAYPTPTATPSSSTPTVSTVRFDSTAARAARWSVTRAITDHFSDRPCLRDPRDVAARVTEGGLTGQSPPRGSPSRSGLHPRGRPVSRTRCPSCPSRPWWSPRSGHGTRAGAASSP